MNIEQQFSLFFDQMADMVFLVEWKNDEFWYTKVNHSAQNKLGIDMVGKKLEDVLPTSVFQTLNPHYLTCVRTKKPVSYSDLNLFVADLPASETSLTLLEQNGKTYVLAITKNIDALKEWTEDYIFLESLVDNTVDAMLVIDTEGIILRFNQAFIQQFGWRPPELIGQPWESIEITPDSLKAQSLRTLEHLKEGTSVSSQETIRLTKWRQPVHTSISYSAIINEQDEVVAISMIYRDIEHLKVLEAQLEESNEAYKSLFSYHKNAICMLDTEGRVVNVNKACENITGFSKDVLTGFPFIDYVKNELPGLDLALDEKVTNYELTIMTATGADLHLNVTHVPIIVKSDIKGMYVIAQDITKQRAIEMERQKLQEKLTFLAYHDSLTKLPNRRLLEEKLEDAMMEAKQSGKMLALLFLDCDHFKEVNDTYGHEVGDELLVAYAKRLEKCIPNDDMVARIGGDEFVILLQNLVNMSMVDTVVNRILTNLNAPYNIQGNQFVATSSIGISTYPANGSTIKELFRNADQALYTVKKSGRNGFSISTA